VLEHGYLGLRGLRTQPQVYGLLLSDPNLPLRHPHREALRSSRRTRSSGAGAAVTYDYPEISSEGGVFAARGGAFGRFLR